MRRVNFARRSALDAALRKHLDDAIHYALPAGGMALWIEAPGIDVDAWARRARGSGVVFAPGSRFALDGRAIAALRVGFCANDERELGRAAAVMAHALRR
jgi:DNA-binding transcriptional MocR family regulator